MRTNLERSNNTAACEREHAAPSHDVTRHHHRHPYHHSHVHNIFFFFFFIQEFAELLVRKGASASYKDSAGASVLVHAAHAKMPKVVRALLDAPASAGVDKDAASDDGVTALIAAAMKVRPLSRLFSACLGLPSFVAWRMLHAMCAPYCG